MAVSAGAGISFSAEKTRGSSTQLASSPSFPPIDNSGTTAGVDAGAKRETTGRRLRAEAVPRWRVGLV